MGIQESDALRVASSGPSLQRLVDQTAGLEPRCGTTLDVAQLGSFDGQSREGVLADEPVEPVPARLVGNRLEEGRGPFFRERTRSTCPAHVLEQPARARALGTRARELVIERYDVETMVQKTLQIYREIAAANPIPEPLERRID